MKHINVNDLEFKWNGQENILLKIDRLSIAKGERFFLQGESGSGKTSLLSLLAGITTPQKGGIELLGQQINKMKASERDEFRAKHMGYIFQLFITKLIKIKTMQNYPYSNGLKHGIIGNVGTQLWDIKR